MLICVKLSPPSGNREVILATNPWKFFQVFLLAVMLLFFQVFLLAVSCCAFVGVVGYAEARLVNFDRKQVNKRGSSPLPA